MGFKTIFHQIKSKIPFGWLQPYHYFLARLAAFVYRNPSKELVVIGVTGTNGKTTTTYFIAKALEASGFKTGCTTTAIMKIGEREWLNRTKMTMPGRFFMQRMLRDMVKAGCRYAILETSSQGLLQHRHIGIDYDMAVFTNLTPEHIEAHGGFEAYKSAKAILFQTVASARPKTIAGKLVPKAVVLNRNSPHADFYARAAGKTPIAWYGMKARAGDFVPEEIKEKASSTYLRVANTEVNLHVPGLHNVENAMAALCVCRILEVDMKKAAELISKITTVPGRMERVELGQPWTVFVDYAYEPESLRRCLATVKAIPHTRVIHVLGSCGGGRDVSRRPILGALSAAQADVVIVTNEDPYDDDPNIIIDQVLQGALSHGKILNQNAFAILDRQTAINKAMALAEPNDIVLLTGKGCEPWICVAHGQKLAWDERAAAETAIRIALDGKRSR